MPQLEITRYLRRMIHTAPALAVSSQPVREAAVPAWAPPRFEVIALDCEITAYAPDGDLPLF